MGRRELIQGLRDLGYEVQELTGNCISFPFTIRAGRFAGKTVTIALQANDDWPFTPPPGPHVSPPLLPQLSGTNWPLQGIHPGRIPACLNANWQYWSRPFPNWAGSDRSTRTYVEHLHHVFDAVPAIS